MKCPMLILGRPLVDTKEYTDFGDCLQEECAWWHEGDQCCSVKSIAPDIFHISLSLATLASKKSINVQLAK